MDKHPLQVMIEEAGYKCRSYSGRGMFGKACLGVDLDSAHQLGGLVSGLMAACLMGDPEGGDEYDAMNRASDAVRHMSWDSMGRGTIYYWPGVPYTDDEAEEDEDDEG
jgi:hypothetical protein